MSISSQIQELTLTLTTQVTNAIKEGLFIRPDIIPDQHIENETDIDIEPITQESQLTNKDITDMELEMKPRKKKERLTNKTIDGTTVIAPSRLSRQANIRSQEAALKKTQKNGGKTERKKV